MQWPHAAVKPAAFETYKIKSQELINTPLRLQGDGRLLE